jgi:hypothetical protein
MLTAGLIIAREREMGTLVGIFHMATHPDFDDSPGIAALIPGYGDPGLRRVE